MLVLTNFDHLWVVFVFGIYKNMSRVKCSFENKCIILTMRVWDDKRKLTKVLIISTRICSLLHATQWNESSGTCKQWHEIHCRLLHALHLPILRHVKGVMLDLASLFCTTVRPWVRICSTGSFTESVTREPLQGLHLSNWFPGQHTQIARHWDTAHWFLLILQLSNFFYFNNKVFMFKVHVHMYM